MNGNTRKGKIAVHKVMAKLLELEIDVLETPEFWYYDILTRFDIKIEVKYANATIGRNSRGVEYETFAFRVKPREKQVCDFLVLVLETKRGTLYYVLPKTQITALNISFNPFSRQPNKYKRFKNRWDYITECYRMREEALSDVPTEKNVQDYYKNIRPGNKSKYEEKYQIKY